MEKLSCESFVKWRTTSSSLTSGSIAGFLRRRFSGMSAAISFGVSRSVGHWPKAPRPGREYSKMIFSGCFCIAMCFSPLSRTHGGFEGFAERIGVLLDVFACAGLGRADQQSVPQFGVIVRQVEATDDAASRKFGDDGRHRTIEQQHRFVESRAIKRELHALDARERSDELVGARVRCIRHA